MKHDCHDYIGGNKNSCKWGTTEDWRNENWIVYAGVSVAIEARKLK